MQVPQQIGQDRGVLLLVAGDDRAGDDELRDLDALGAERLVEQLRVGGLPGERDARPRQMGPWRDRRAPLTNRIVPRSSPRKRMPGTTWWTAATGP